MRETRVSLFLCVQSEENLEFRTYIFNQDKSILEQSIQGNCVAIIGDQELSILFSNIYKKRNEIIANHLSDSLLVVTKAFEFKSVDLRNL